VDNSLFFNNIKENENNKDVLLKIKEYVSQKKSEQLYLITSPLGGKKYSYSYEKDVIVILSPRHKIIFLDVGNNNELFKEYYEDFIEDLGSISDKFKYKEHIGRPREWRKELTACENININININIESLLSEHLIEENLYRKNELIISLLVGSINNVDDIGFDEPKYLLDKIKNKIVLFDGEQTRFIYKKINKKSIYIQGLSGTGKTELLLHKLKEIYASTEKTKIFFTCHNIALANSLKKRIPDFFNFMKVEKQIKWHERLWTDRAWGSMRNPDSGLYTYICNFYGIPFSRYSNTTNYKKIFTNALNEINAIDANNFKYAFDYILIDERQDFPDIFFKLCEKITKEKIYIAGDIFQDIFDSNFEKRVVDVDFILNRCYRTDPKTLMFSHAIGMGLFEENKLNWLTDKEWEASGYIVKRENNSVQLYRESIRRFNDLKSENIKSTVISKLESLTQIITILEKLKEENPTLAPDDIAIIILDDNRTIYEFIDRLEYEVINKLGWNVNKSYESKEEVDGSLFISNRNNVKGLEFPFVICITAKIQDSYRYRNTLYTMLTRSFIQSYLLVSNDNGLEIQQKGLDIINNENCIRAKEPTEQEKINIRNTIIKLKSEKNISYKDFLNEVFSELGISADCRRELERHIPEKIRFNKEETIQFVNANKKYYC